MSKFEYGSKYNLTASVMRARCPVDYCDDLNLAKKKVQPGLVALDDTMLNSARHPSRLCHLDLTWESRRHGSPVSPPSQTAQVFLQGFCTQLLNLHFHF